MLQLALLPGGAADCPGRLTPRAETLYLPGDVWQCLGIFLVVVSTETDIY